MPNPEATYDQLTAYCRETAQLSSIQSLLEWDERTLMPPEAGAFRADQITLLAGMLHKRRTNPQLGDWLNELLTRKN